MNIVTLLFRDFFWYFCLNFYFIFSHIPDASSSPPTRSGFHFPRAQAPSSSPRSGKIITRTSWCFHVRLEYVYIRARTFLGLVIIWFICSHPVVAASSARGAVTGGSLLPRVSVIAPRATTSNFDDVFVGVNISSHTKKYR